MIKFITVVSRMEKGKYPTPLYIEWEDGRIFEIDKVLDTRKKASTKGGGAGLRYTVRIKGKERYLFLVNYEWFIET